MLHVSSSTATVFGWNTNSAILSALATLGSKPYYAKKKKDSQVKSEKRST